MADTFRYRFGETNPIQVAYSSASGAPIIEIGDMVFLNSSNQISPASKQTYGSAVADPGSGPTLTAATGYAGNTGLAAGTYLVAYSYVTASGETLISPTGTVTLTVNQAINVANITQPAGVKAVNWYVSSAAGGTTLLFYIQNAGGAFQVVSLPDASAAAIPSASTATALAVTQQSFISAFLGVAGQRFDGTNVAIGIKDGTIRVDTSGVFEYDVATGTTLIAGDLVGPASNAAGTALLNQTVIKVANKQLAVGRVERTGSSVDKIKVRIFSAKVGTLTN